jgi:hypothetical protein
MISALRSFHAFTVPFLVRQRKDLARNDWRQGVRFDFARSKMNISLPAASDPPVRWSRVFVGLAVDERQMHYKRRITRLSQFGPSHRPTGQNSDVNLPGVADRQKAGLAADWRRYIRVPVQVRLKAPPAISRCLDPEESECLGRPVRCSSPSRRQRAAAAPIGLPHHVDCRSPSR